MNVKIDKPPLVAALGCDLKSPVAAAAAAQAAGPPKSLATLARERADRALAEARKADDARQRAEDNRTGRDQEVIDSYNADANRLLDRAMRLEEEARRLEVEAGVQKPVAAAPVAAAAPPARTGAAAPPAPKAMSSRADIDAAADRGRAAFAERLAKVSASEEFEGREREAAEFLADPDLIGTSAETIIRMLSHLPRQQGCAEMLALMRSDKNPNLGTGGTEYDLTGGGTSQADIARSWERAHAAVAAQRNTQGDAR